jgi:site-specific DNA-methyltransferase (adenine-specific)
MKRPTRRRAYRPLPFRLNGVGPSSPGKLLRTRTSDIVCTDALSLLHALKPGSAHLIFLDPPFNLGKSYGRLGSRGDRLDSDAYFAYMWQVLQRSSIVLADGGSLFLYHVPRWAVRLSAVLSQTLEFRHWIAISMKNGFVRTRALYPAHYALLHYSKGQPLTFSRPKLPIALCQHCLKPTKDYGGYARFVRDGINLSDVWDDLSPVRHKKHKNRTPNELPVQIPSRVLEMSGAPRRLFVDPFAGSGTTLIEAARRGMVVVAGDREMSNCRLMYRRLTDWESREGEHL